MASSLPLPELIFLSPKTRTPKHHHHLLSLSRHSLSKLNVSGKKTKFNLPLRTPVTRALKEDTAVIEEREREILKELNGNGNGRVNGSVERYVNGGLVSVEEGESSSNESLVKYVNGNGAAAVATAEILVEEKKEGSKEEGRQKRIEEIGKEDAWFKRAGQQQIEVSVAPGGRWSRFKTYSTIQRTLEIWGSVLTFIFKAWLNNQKFSYRGGMTEEKKMVRRKALAKWLKESILRLGPTFIKIGQQFSTRVDILAQEYVDQLSELQDQVPPFPSETAVSIVEEELGAPVGDIFDRFDYEPIAAASLGQVHRARLKGQEVVIKVQRPGLKDLFDIDLKNLRVIAEYLQKVDPKSDGAKRDWVAIYDECANVLYQEIDYTMEASNAELFASNFKEMEYVKVPAIYWEYTTPQVLTMEYVPGIKINKIQALDQLGVDRKRLGRYAVESYLEQILSHGFFHADPVSFIATSGFWWCLKCLLFGILNMTKLFEKVNIYFELIVLLYGDTQKVVQGLVRPLLEGLLHKLKKKDLENSAGDAEGARVLDGLNEGMIDLMPPHLEHPGNIAVDDVNGGRLIFYDFGMMGSISPNIREGLLEAFYGIYEKDPDKVLEAMIQMGVLVPTGDMTAVRRTALFFLNSFEERLAAQRREREIETAQLGFKKPLSKDEKIEKKKQRLAAIGEDLLSIAADQPFRFPATFTFVVRAFSVLDGIGKGLDPRFDITEIAKPYALELLKFREAGVEVLLKDFRKRWDRQSRAIYNLFRQADRVQKLADTIQRLEQGDLKLRVRTLEAERAFQRVAAVQKIVGSAVAVGSLVNLATILYLNSIRVPAIAASIFCAFFSFQVLFGLIKVKKLDQQERLITGTA